MAGYELPRLRIMYGGCFRGFLAVKLSAPDYGAHSHRLVMLYKLREAV